MSIYGTFWAADDGDHTDTCAAWVRREGLLEKSGTPCSCGQPGAPILYRGSHILPAESDQRGGYVGLAEIPSHITRDGRDDGPEDGVTPWPYVRVSVGTEDAVLDEAGALAMYHALGNWLLARRSGGAVSGPR